MTSPASIAVSMWLLSGGVACLIGSRRGRAGAGLFLGLMFPLAGVYLAHFLKRSFKNSHLYEHLAVQQMLQRTAPRPKYPPVTPPIPAPPPPGTPSAYPGGPTAPLR